MSCVGSCRRRQCGAEPLAGSLVWLWCGGRTEVRSVPRVCTERSEVPLVTLNLCVMKRYNLGEGDLVSTLEVVGKQLFTCGSNFPCVIKGHVRDCCCCLHITPFFLPNDISSTPSVLPDSLSEIQILWSQTVREKTNVANVDMKY